MNWKTVLLALFISACGSNDSGKESEAVNGTKREFKEVGLTITIPEGFGEMSKEDVRTSRMVGEAAVENTTGTDQNNGNTEPLFGYIHGRGNTFSATITPYDEKTDGNYHQTNEELEQLLYETFRQHLPKAQIDTSFTTETIDGREVDRNYFKITYPDKSVVHTYVYNRLVNGYDLAISVTFNDEKIGRQMLEAVRTARFKE